MSADYQDAFSKILTGNCTDLKEQEKAVKTITSELLRINQSRQGEAQTLLRHIQSDFWPLGMPGGLTGGFI